MDLVLQLLWSEPADGALANARLWGLLGGLGCSVPCGTDVGPLLVGDTSGTVNVLVLRLELVHAQSGEYPCSARLGLCRRREVRDRCCSGLGRRDLAEPTRDGGRRGLLVG